MNRIGWLRRSGLGKKVRRFLAATALVAQCSALIAPLSDIHAAPATPALTELLAPTPVSPVAVTASHPEAPPHDAAKCPACIAQSIVAYQSTSVHSITFAATVAQLDPLERIHAPRSTLRILPPSRGPPPQADPRT